MILLRCAHNIVEQNFRNSRKPQFETTALTVLD